MARPVRPAGLHRGQARALPPGLRPRPSPTIAPRSRRSPPTRRPPTFDNTIGALERSGQDLTRVSNLFFILGGADTNDALEAVEREVSPLLARHSNALYLNRALFARIADLWRRRDALGLNAEQARVLDRYHTRFVRAGAALDQPAQDRLATINERLASLGTQFGQNVLADEKSYAMILEEADLAGLPEFARASARAAAQERGRPGKYAFTLGRSSVEAFLQFSSRRDLREKLFQAWIKRGESGGATDNRAVVAEIVALRAERAKLLGFATFADYRLDDQMAKTPAAARGLLENVWTRARAKAGAERDALQAMVAEEGGNFALAPHDWRYYAEKLRKARYDLDETEIKPYFQLDRLIDAAFDTAGRLFGLAFTAADIPLYHPDARAWEVKDASGRHVGLFIGDYFARASKHSGAWMTSLRDQEKLMGEIRPVILNVCNFAKPAAGEPALLSFDDARTLFHEFGHALHGLAVQRHLSAARRHGGRQRLRRAAVAALRALAGDARNSGDVRPPRQDRRSRCRRRCSTGCWRRARSTRASPRSNTPPARCSTSTSIRCLTAKSLDVGAFEREGLAALHMPAEIVMRHRLPHFQHLFSGGGYAAGYYSYMWSEVLDADAFEAFKETGDVFDPATAKRLRDFIYSAGNLRDPADAYKAFRGRLPSVDALLKKRGLTDAAV